MEEKTEGNWAEEVGIFPPSCDKRRDWNSQPNGPTPELGPETEESEPAIRVALSVFYLLAVPEFAVTTLLPSAYVQKAIYFNRNTTFSYQILFTSAELTRGNGTRDQKWWQGITVEFSEMRSIYYIINKQ